MSVPVMLASEQLLPDLESVLSTTGAAVTTEAMPAHLAERGFLSILNCNRDDGETVHVECHRATDAPGMVLLVLKPVRAGKRKDREPFLLAQIKTALRQVGATDWPPP